MEKRIILLVEDNPDDEALTLRAFHKSNIANEVVVARDGVEAIEYLFNTPASSSAYRQALPAIILLDLKLPRIDGLEVLRRLRAHEKTKYIPVVILTSSREEQDIINGYSFGANSYITKPVDFEKFVEAVRNLGVYWLLLNEPFPQAGEYT